MSSLAGSQPDAHGLGSVCHLGDSQGPGRGSMVQWKGLSLERQESWVHSGSQSVILLGLGLVITSRTVYFAVLKYSAGCPDPTSLGIFASYVLSFMPHHAHGFIIHGVLSPAQSHSPSDLWFSNTLFLCGIVLAAFNRQRLVKSFDGVAPTPEQVLTAL